MKGFNKKLKRFLCNPLVKRVTMIVLFAMVVASVSVYFFLNVQESKKVKKSNLPEFDKSEKVLTIFTILRELQYTSLEGTAPSQVSWLEALHTYNAIVSWGYLQGVDILLFGDQKSCDFAMTFAPPGTVCLPIPCINKEFNVPRYDCLYGKAAELSRTEFLMYSNSDMVYFNDLIEAITKVSDSHEDFLMIGRRTDIMYPRKIEFEKPNWREELRSYVLDHGELHGKYGIDYFAYRTRHARKMPPFLVGRIRWDNWLVAQFIGNKDSVAVDSTKVVLAVHLNHMHVGGSHSRTGTDYNKELTSSERIDPKKIGDLDSTDLILLPEEKVRKHNDKSMGSCPKCTLKRNVQSMDVMLYKHSTDMTVIVSTVNFGYIDFAINWLCSLKKVGVRNYIFHAADETMFQTLFDMGLPVIYYASEQDRQYQKDQGLDGKAHDYGSVGYQGLMNTRTEFIYKIMQKGYNVLLCDVDIVFLKNPLKYLDNNLDIQGGAHKKEKLTGGYVYFRATEAAKKIWVKVLTQHRDMFNQIQTMENFNPHSMTEQELLNELLIADKKDKGEVKWGVVPEKIIADGKRFFIDKETQKKGEWPAAIHNNYVIGASNKRERFVNASLWMVEPDLSCKAPFPLPPPPTGKPKLVIKILAYNRPKSILRLFKSLDQAFYDGDKVDLEIYVDFPDEEDEKKEEVISDRTKVVLFSERFVWRHGKKDVIARTEHFGLANQWLNSWFPTDPNEVCLFIEDDNIVSPHFYRWLKSALNTYHTADNWDPRVFGLAMQNQHMIPGNYPKKPVEFLEEGVHFYKYQLLSTWGPVFFPFHWSQFLTWYSEKSTNDNFMPLFSNMITNTWFLSRGGGRSVWSAWFMRFAAERGLYCIYTNFELGRSFVVNYRDKGVNYKDDKGPNSNMVEVVEDYMNKFPNTSEIPIYDFHFNKITEDPSVLEGRAIYSDIYNIELH